MILEFSELAQIELEDARAYYNLQQENLGESFKQHISIAHQHRKPFYEC